MRDLSTVDNPYASTGVDPTPVPDPALWRVEGKFLLVCDGAVLPDVPLIGKDEAELVRASVKLRAQTIWSNLTSMSVMPFFAARNKLVGVFGNYGSVGVLFGILALLLLLHRMQSAGVRISFAMSKRAARRRKIGKWAASGLMFTCCALLGFVVTGKPGMTPALILMWGCLVMVFASGVWYFIMQWTSFQPAKSKDGWLYLHRVPEDALRRLDELSASS